MYDLTASGMYREVRLSHGSPYVPQVHVYFKMHIFVRAHAYLRNHCFLKC